MWLWIILSGLLILIAWALWWVLGWGTTIPILATAVIFLVKWLLARRAAQKLEGAIAQQGNQQAMNARPERRAEIQELQKQLTAGIDALKTSKVGRSGKRGTAALYSMPWYMIIGPPGAGKTTALKISGLVFPVQGGTGGGVRGVGGTRNCDWWFTNEAILLDTAGRYTTEQDDRDEWISFLQFLQKYRPNRPINDEATRLHLMAALSFVDAVVVFDQDTPLELIQLLKPDVLVKGGDWQPDQIVGADIVISNGGSVLSLPFIDGYSTTAIETKIKNQPE